MRNIPSRLLCAAVTRVPNTRVQKLAGWRTICTVIVILFLACNFEPQLMNSMLTHIPSVMHLAGSSTTTMTFHTSFPELTPRKGHNDATSSPGVVYSDRVRSRGSTWERRLRRSYMREDPIAFIFLLLCMFFPLPRIVTPQICLTTIPRIHRYATWHTMKLALFLGQSPGLHVRDLGGSASKTFST